MSARKLVYQGMVLGPVVMLGFLGLGARAYHDPYEFDSFDDGKEAVIAAYVAPMREVVDLPWTYEEPRNRAIARAAAHDWLDLMRRGKLQPMPAEDDGESDYAVKEQVLLGRYRLMESLSRCAAFEFKRGRYSQAADDILLEMDLAQILKETDTRTIYVSAQRQNMLRRRLRSAAVHLTASRKLTIARRLLALAAEDSRTISYLSARQGFVRRAYVQPVVRPMRERATAVGVALERDRLSPASFGPGEVGTRVENGPGMYVLACVTEKAHYAGLRTLTTELGLKWRWPSVDPLIASFDLALGASRRHAG